jgi:catechol 2,3-dioxygenase-like lactoylglutathione lyase family enzyme
MDKIVISGIQQVGIGVASMPEAWKWYRKYFGTDIRIFEEAAPAPFMTPYTGGVVRDRYAALVLNLQGGGGFEVWQYTSRVPEAPKQEVLIGDLGIFAAKIKCRDVMAAYNFFKTENQKVSRLYQDYSANHTFYVQDPYGNYFQLVKADDWFTDENKLTGAAFGAVIGVSDMDKSIKFYGDILGYDKVLYDTTGVFDDMAELPGGKNSFRRVILTHSQARKGAFSPVLGNSQIELLQVTDRMPSKIFEGRFWGDLGFIHLCFDIQGMNALREKCKNWGCPFTVDTGNSFDMGDAAGGFAYIEDPDGALVEFVETHKVPIMKKWGLFLNLTKRNPEKPLPRFMLKALSFNRVKG